MKNSLAYLLGILFTKKLVSLLNNGKYHIKSDENIGSVSTITFDAKKADNFYIKDRIENISDKIVICITDDCPIVRNVMKRTIQSILKDAQILQFEHGENLLVYNFDHEQIYVHILDQHMHSTGGKLLGHEVSNILKLRLDETHYTISMSGNDILSSHDSFDIVWNKPPPPNEVIEHQIRDLIRHDVFNSETISVEVI